MMSSHQRSALSFFGCLGADGWRPIPTLFVTGSGAVYRLRLTITGARY
jgi:hypothetical protein